MAGMDANLTIEQARKQQERICAGSEHQGPKKKGSMHDELHTKIEHQGK